MQFNKLIAPALKVLPIVVLVAIVSGCVFVPTPKLTVEDRKADIQFLADWARDHSPLAALAQEHKGNPSYEELLPKYLDYAEQAESNKEYYQVVRGYYDLICSAGHGGIVEEGMLELAGLGVLLGVMDLDISPFTVNRARYWSRLANGNLSVRALPPFHVLHEDDKYFTADDWKANGVSVPKGSQILKVNGMSCAAYLSYLRANTVLRYDAFPKPWLKRCLLTVDEGDDFKGWQVDFLLPDSSTHSAFVPMVRLYSRPDIVRKGCGAFVPKTRRFPPPHEKMLRAIRPKENCKCVELTDEVAYVRIRSMMPGGLWGLIFPAVYRQNGKSIRRFLERADGKYRKLIIDVRGNGGGVPYYFYENLIRPFLDEPVIYIQVAGVRRKYIDNLKPAVLKTLRKGCSRDKEHVVNVEQVDCPPGFDPAQWVFYRLTRRIEPSNPYTFDGDLYVLVNENTFSAADDFANVVKRIGFAKLVGRNTGGGCAAYIGSPAIRLPGSGMIFRVETEIVINPDGSINELFGTPPDLKLLPAKMPKSITAEELFKDPWIKHIIHEM